MTKGLHIVDVECQVIVFRWLRSMGKYTKYIFIIGYSGDLWRYLGISILTFPSTNGRIVENQFRPSQFI